MSGATRIDRIRLGSSVILMLLGACAKAPSSFDATPTYRPDGTRLAAGVSMEQQATELGAGHSHDAPDSLDAPGGYTCPMHTEVQEPAPGDCPICGMDLVPVREGGTR